MQSEHDQLNHQPLHRNTSMVPNAGVTLWSQPRNIDLRSVAWEECGREHSGVIPAVSFDAEPCSWKHLRCNSSPAIDDNHAIRILDPVDIDL